MERKIARFNERLTVQKNEVMVDKYGNHKNVWTDYYSCYTWLVFEDHHEGIVSRELWDSVQAKMKVRIRGERIPKALDGLLFCSTCGRRLGVKRQSGKIIYHCPMHTGQGLQKTGSAPLSKTPQIVETELKKTVLKECRGYVKWIDGRREAIRTADQNTGLMGRLEQQAIDLMRQKKETDKKLMHLFDDYHDKLIDLDSFLDMREQLSNRKTELETAVTGVLSEQRQTKVRVKKVREYLASISGLSFSVWNEEAIRSLVDKVELMPNGTVKVTLMMREEILKLTKEEPV